MQGGVGHSTPQVNFQKTIKHKKCAPFETLSKKHGSLFRSNAILV